MHAIAIFRLHAACCAGDTVKLRMPLLAEELLVWPGADSWDPAFPVAEVPPAVNTPDRTQYATQSIRHVQETLVTCWFRQHGDLNELHIQTR
jgi:hypothetical protein